MTIFMLDTNICSFIIRGRSPTAEKRLVQLAPRHEIVISAIAHFELRKGALIRASAKLSKDISMFVERLAGVLPWDQEAAEEAARIHATLSTKGRLISLNDTMIAGHALATDSVLVTNNTHEFKRVRGLKIEDWA
jgi:tRNA(fMet)-specific endonuclease VapC